jgi:hypothetical protein
MKSKKATKWLEDEKRWLEEQLASRKEQTDKMWKELERAPRERIEVGTLEIVNGKHVEGTQTIVVAHTDQQRSREYDDAMRAQGHLEHRLKQIEFLLAPSMGRAKGTRNRQHKAPNPTFVEALKALQSAPDPKPTRMKLATEYSGIKGKGAFEARKKWVSNFNKFKQKHRDSRGV